MKRTWRIIPRRKCGVILKKYWMLYCCIGVLAVVSAVFGVYPMVCSILHSSFKTSTISIEPVFVGLGNYMKLFKDSYFQDSLKVTLLFTALNAPLSMATALLLAQLLGYRGIRRGAQLISKLVIFIPLIAPDVASIVVWKHFFNSNSAMNSLLEILGLSPLGWLAKANLAIGVLTFVELWKYVGLYTTIFLTSYRPINRSMYEAAIMNKANRRQTHAYIILPSLKPAFMPSAVYIIVQFLKIYMVSRAITFGGPNYAVNFLSYYVYSKYEEINFGSAMAIVTFLFLLVALLTLVGPVVGRRLNETK